MTSKGILIGFLTISTLAVVAKRPFTIKISEISCIRYAEPVSQFECYLETFKNRTVINGFIIFSEETNALNMEVNSDLLRSVGPPVKFININVDACKILVTMDSNGFLASMLAHIRKTQHVPERCPICANDNFTVTRYVLDADILPLYTPEFNYSIDMRLFSGSKLLAKLLAKGSVETKRKMHTSIALKKTIV